MTPADCIKDGMVRCQDCKWFLVVRKWRLKDFGEENKFMHHNILTCMSLDNRVDGVNSLGKYQNGKDRPGASLVKHLWRRCDHFEVKRGIGGYA